MCLALAACLGFALPASALVLHPYNEAPPTDRPPDEAVGQWLYPVSGTLTLKASCVPIGADYVLTTRHQGGGVGATVVIGGLSYTVSELFNNPSADIRIARITAAGGAPANLSYFVNPCTASTVTPGVTTLVIGGYGKGRGALLPSGNGYAWAADPVPTLRWGANLVDSAGYTNGTYTTQLLVSDFDEFGVTGEAAIAEFDSGGGWFVKGGTTWYVAGLSRSAARFGESDFRPADYLDAVNVGYYSTWINETLNRTVWNQDQGGNWSDAAKWSTGVPNGADRVVVFDGAITSDRTVTLDMGATVGTLRFDDNNNFTLTGTLTLTLDVAKDRAAIDVVDSGGTHRIATPILLRDNLIVTQNSSGTLTLAGVISQSNPLKAIVKEGSGVLCLSAANTFSGGMTINAGTVRAAHAGALGTGGVTLAAGTLEFQSDSAVTFNNNVMVSGNAAFQVGPVATGLNQTLTAKTLTVTGDRAVTFLGSGGYSLAFDGLVSTSLVTSGVTFNTAGADVAFLKGIQHTSGPITKTGGKTLTISGPQNYYAGSTFNVAGGLVVFNTDVGGATPNYNLAMTVNGTGADVHFAAGQHLGSLAVMLGSAQVTASGSRVLVTKSLTINPASGVLDLVNNDLVIDYTGTSPLATVRDWVRAGYNNAGGGDWSGKGLTSSAAAADSLTLTALGVADNATLGRTTFSGETVDSTSVLVKYTYWGDANLDGRVTFDDYDIIDYYYWFPVPAAQMGWWTGDFDYDGNVDFDDYDLIDYGYWFQGSPLAGSTKGDALGSLTPLDLGSPGTFVSGGVVVPEPGTLALMVLGALAALRRRRR